MDQITVTRKRQRWLGILIAILMICHTDPSVNAEDPPADYKTLGKGFIEKYCSKCHSPEDPQAELVLTRFSDSDSIIRERKI